jgi:hypothetical protein
MNCARIRYKNWEDHGSSAKGRKVFPKLYHQNNHSSVPMLNGTGGYKSQVIFQFYGLSVCLLSLTQQFLVLCIHL